MSTKTSIKRIAAVAAVALTLGGFSAVSAHATAQTGAATTVAGGVFVTADALGTVGGTGLSATGTGIAGANNYVTLSVVAGGAGVPVVATATGGTLVSATTGVTGSGTASIVTPANTAAVVTVPTPTVGTITVSSYLVTNGVQASTATSTVTITVSAALPGTVYNQSKVYISATTNTEPLADDAAASLVAGYAASSTKVARISIRQYSTADTTTAMTTNTAASVSISGAGTVDTDSTGATRGPSASIASVSGTGGLQTFYVFPDGRSGTATITVTVNGVVASTKTFTFTGTLNKYIETTTDTPKTYIPVGGTDVRNITGLDSNANTATLGTIYAVSDNTAAATVAVSGGAVTVTGVAAGKANITVCDTSACTSATKTLVLPVEVTKATAKSFAITTDATSYAPGAKITITVTATDSNGRPVGDGSVNLFSSTGLTSDVQVGSPTYTAAAAVTLKGGVATFTAYAPVSGSVTFSATQGTGVDAVAAGGTAAVVSSTTVSVVNASADAAQAAVDAANEATDAANAATDAANNAMDSADAAQQAALDAGDKADAALAAVTDLASKVADIATQISALSSLVSKIAASVAKISAKVKA